MKSLKLGFLDIRQLASSEFRAVIIVTTVTITTLSTKLEIDMLLILIIRTVSNFTKKKKKKATTTKLLNTDYEKHRISHFLLLFVALFFKKTTLYLS